MKFKNLAILFTLTFSTTTFAKLAQVLKVTSDYNTDTTQLYVESDANGKFIKLVQKVIETDGDTETKNFTISELERGVTLLEKDERKIIKLDLSGNFHEIYGGSAEIDFLGNAITGRRDQMSIDLVFENNSWQVQKKGQKITRFYVKANKVLGKVVGIDEIQTLR
jgi:hypothetical protein